jgi:pyruvate dehydrogenase E1 component alpha subunit
MDKELAEPFSDLDREPESDVMLAMFERMLLIRRTEEQLGADSKGGKLPGNVHLYAGQEAIAVGVCAHLTDGDFITSTHRGHGHFLAKGGTPRQLISEIHGKADGACGGCGGSMHVADLSKGMLGANAIVGGGIGLAGGAALAAQLKGGGQVAIAFFGDGAASEGVLSEVMNIAALWKLPLILVCETNAYCGISATGDVTAGNIADRAKPFGIPSVAIDGNDLLAVWSAARAAITAARRGEGPSFIEAKSYRLRGHIEIEAGFLQRKYRTDEEIAGWAARDPIVAFGRLLEDRQVLSRAQVAAIERRVREQVADAEAFAEAGELPNMSIVDAAIISGPPQ